MKNVCIVLERLNAPAPEGLKIALAMRVRFNDSYNQKYSRMKGDKQVKMLENTLIFPLFAPSCSSN